MPNELENEPENVTSETLTEETSAADSQNPSDETSQQNPPAEETFNLAEIEQQFGVAPGSLTGCTTAAEAMERIAQHADEALSAGLSARRNPVQELVTPAQPFTAQQQTTAQKVAKKAAEPSEVELLRAEIIELKGLFKSQAEANNKAMEAQLAARIEAEIDSWNSPTYGTRSKRFFEQKKAYDELVDWMYTHADGMASRGKAVPQVEYVLRQVRTKHDKHHAAPAPKKPQQAVGTPGTKRDMAAGKEPQNIHMALQQNRM